MARPAHLSSLFDRRYWRERLARLDGCPPHLRLLARPDADDHVATELWLRALDGSPLRALLLEPTFGPTRTGLSAILRERATGAGPDADPATSATDWPDLDHLARRAAEGRALLVVAVESNRRLEDRVLDLVRTIEAAREILAGRTRPVDGARRDGPIAIEGDDDVAAIGRHVLELRRASWTD